MAPVSAAYPCLVEGYTNILANEIPILDAVRCNVRPLCLTKLPSLSFATVFSPQPTAQLIIYNITKELST